MVGYAPTTLYCIESRGKFMNDVKIFNSEEFGQIRTVVIDGEPWFVGKDVAAALGYEKERNALQKHVDTDDALKRGVLTNGGVQEMTVINESGLYSLIFGSKLESAKKFKHWVTSEILPSIRKTGMFSTANAQTEKIPVGEIARLSTVMDRVMVRQNSKPHDIARAFEMLCGQFGIMLPDNFVSVPEYEQMTLANVLQ